MNSTDQNRQFRLAERPQGLPKQSDWELVSEAIADPGDDEILVAVEYISLDPAMRGWMNAGKSYIKPVEIGEVMRAGTAGTVLKSNHADFVEGDKVTGNFGVQTHAVVAGKDARKVDTRLAELPAYLGVLGMPGMTAYFGLLDVGGVAEGETVVVSAASGAVGALVGQIAKLKGCRAVGIAGGPEKCRALLEVDGFDAAVDYKAGDLGAQLDKACPDGIDVDFENVGGEILDTILPRMNTFGRIAVCGLISAYTATSVPPGPVNLRYVLTQRLKMQGLIVFDFARDNAVALADLGAWVKEGKLKLREDVREGGVDAFVETLNLLYTGGNFGKLSLKV